jgi:DNA polymerase
VAAAPESLQPGLFDLVDLTVAAKAGPATINPAAAVPAATALEASAAAPAAAGLSLQELAQACGGCRRCGLAGERQHVVVSRGTPTARLMVIGEGPGAQEDASGQPFVGRAGQLLDQMLASVGIDSNRDAYICNVVKCRPPGNRKPTPAEIAACRPWLEQQIRLVDPAVILLAGASAMEGVLGIKGGITRLRGSWRQSELPLLQGRWLMPILHPSYLLRNPSREQGSPKWLTWHDLQDVRRRLDQLPPRQPSPLL